MNITKFPILKNYWLKRLDITNQYKNLLQVPKVLKCIKLWVQCNLRSNVPSLTGYKSTE